VGKALGCRLHQNKGPDEVKPSSASLTLVKPAAPRILFLRFSHDTRQISGGYHGKKKNMDIPFFSYAHVVIFQNAPTSFYALQHTL
jgi:hypothetical protein